MEGGGTVGHGGGLGRGEGTSSSPHHLSNAVQLGAVQMVLILAILQILVVSNVLIHLTATGEPVATPILLVRPGRTGCI